jgi:hypothetical protein
MSFKNTLIYPIFVNEIIRGWARTNLIVASVNYDYELCPETPFASLKVEALTEFWMSKMKLKSLGLPIWRIKRT